MSVSEFKFHKLNFSQRLFLILCLFLPFQFALNPFPGIDLAIIRVLIPLLFIICIYKNHKIFKDNSQITIFLFILSTLFLFSLAFSENIYWSLRKLLFLASFLPLYFIALSFLQIKKNQIATIKFLSLGGILLAMIALAQFFSQFYFGLEYIYVFWSHHVIPFFLGKEFSQMVLAYPSWLVGIRETTLMRAFAIFPDPHMFAYYLEMLLPWTIALSSESSKYRKILFLGSLIIFLADILSFSRGSYIALIAGSLMVLPLVTMRVRIKIFIAIALITAISFYIPQNPVSQRLTSSFDAQEGSNQGRLLNWQQGLEIIRQNPFGVGIGMYPLAVDPEADYRTPIYAHNLYLDLAAEIGIPAMVIFIFIIISAFNNYWLAARREPFFVAGVACITIFAVHSLVETPLYSVHVLPLILIFLALSVRARNYVS